MKFSMKEVEGLLERDHKAGFVETKIDPKTKEQTVRITSKGMKNYVFNTLAYMESVEHELYEQALVNMIKWKGKWDWLDEWLMNDGRKKMEDLARKAWERENK